MLHRLINRPALKRAAALSAGLFSLSGCGSHAGLTTWEFKQPHTTAIVRGKAFLHRVILKSGQGDNLHVYIEGDGRPWVTPTSRALNPTPKRPVMLELMAQDSAPALYLGRPCYFSTGDDLCSDSRWWTSHRYSRAIVDSLNAALDQYASRYSSITLIGYSGGGTLAYLLAATRTDVEALVTLAANLNVGLWGRKHGYTPLTGSLDPATSPPLPQGIRQWHLWGDRDTNISREVLTSVLQLQDGVALKVLPGVDHSCCWQQEWPAVLRQLE